MSTDGALPARLPLCSFRGPRRGVLVPAATLFMPRPEGHAGLATAYASPVSLACRGVHRRRGHQTSSSAFHLGRGLCLHLHAGASKHKGTTGRVVGGQRGGGGQGRACWGLEG